MKRALLAAGLLCCALVPVRAQSRVAGVWQTEIQPNSFWTVELRFDQGRLVGGVGTGLDPIELSDGIVDGDTVSFKVETPDGDRTITFRGTVQGDEVAFTRDVQVRPGGSQGGANILGAGGPRTFTLTRVPAGQAPKRPRGAAWPRQLTIYDRDGKVLRTLGEAALYNQPTFSPDGSALAVVLLNDIWTIDISRGTRTRVTSTRWIESAPIWSPDGRHIAYHGFRQGSGALYRKASDGTGSEELLYQHTPGAAMLLTDWSADGRFLSFGSGGVLYAVPVEGERQPLELAREEFALQAARFSPDSRFLAYRSDASGRFEVYVHAFDAARGLGPEKWQVSSGGVGMVHWRRDGRELIYLGADGGVMAVDVTLSPAFKAGKPRPLFRVAETIPLGGTPGALGSVSRDGRRIALAVPVAPNRKAIALPVETLARYTGPYTGPGMDVAVTRDGEQIILEAFGDRMPMTPQSETSFFFRSLSQEVDFVLDEKGAVSHLLFYGGGPPIRMARKTTP